MESSTQNSHEQLDLSKISKALKEKLCSENQQGKNDLGEKGATGTLRCLYYIL